MSWQLDQERGIKSKIEMPITQQEVAPTQELQNEQQYNLHPDLAKELPQETQFQEHEEQVEQQEEQEVEEVKHEPIKETKNEKNIRILREKAERAEKAERERDELIRKIYDLEAKRNEQPEKELPKEVEQDLFPEDLVEGKHLSKYDRKLKRLEEELESYKQQTSVSAVEAKLKAQYPDFEKVVSADNIEILKYDYPEIAETLNKSSTDLYSKAKSAYTLIKKLGIHQDDFQQDKARVEKNLAKPKSLSSISPQRGESPIHKANAFANGLTDELKEQLRKEMNDARHRM